MHRYVVLIATHPGDAGRDISARLAPHLAGWRKPLDTEAVQAWVHADASGLLSHRSNAPQSLVIGRDFSHEPHLAAVGEAGWGAYVAIEVAGDTVEVRRDPTGRLDCWRLALPGADLIFSHYEDVRRLQAGPLDLNWDYLAYHLGTDWLRGRETGYASILEVLPGEALTYGPAGRSIRQFWRPGTLTRRPYATQAEAAAALRAAAELAARAWTMPDAPMLLDLSGGLDSAIVLGLMRATAPKGQITCVNWVTESADGDERRFARDAADMHGVRLIEQTLTIEDVQLQPRFPCRLMRPAPRSLSLGYDDHGARLAMEVGAGAFFTGTGGDHLFFDHLPGVAARDLLHHRGPPREVIAVAADMARMTNETVWSLGAAVLRHELGRNPPKVEARPNRFLTRYGASLHDARRFAHPWAFETAWKAEPAKRRQVLNIAELQRHYYRYGRAEAAEEVHPLFSQPVIEAALRTPAYWFAAGGRQRGLARQVFSDLVPGSILERRTKGSNTAYWTHSLIAGLPTLRTLLLDGRLVAEGLLDRARLEAGLTPLALASGKDLLALVNCLSVELWIRQALADQADRLSSPA